MSSLSTAQGTSDTSALPECEICGGTHFRVRVDPIHVGKHYEITARCRFCGTNSPITREAARALRLAAGVP